MTLIKDGSALNLLKLRSSSTPIVSASALLAMKSSSNLKENIVLKIFKEKYFSSYFDCSLSLRTASGGSTVDSYSAEIAMFMISPILKNISLKSLKYPKWFHCYLTLLLVSVTLLMLYCWVSSDGSLYGLELLGSIVSSPSSRILSNIFRSSILLGFLLLPTNVVMKVDWWIKLFDD